MLVYYGYYIIPKIYFFFNLIEKGWELHLDPKIGVSVPDIMMKNNATVPSLSIDGWVDTPIKTLDYLFSHIFLSDNSQSYLYYGNISSVSYLMYKNQSSINDLIRDLTEMVKNYLGRYYDSVNCEIIDSSGDSITGSLTMSLSTTDSGNLYTLNKVIEYTDSSVRKIIDSL